MLLRRIAKSKKTAEPEARLQSQIIQGLNVDRHPLDAREAVKEGLGDRRMCVDSEHHLFDGRLELTCSNGFGDDLCSGGGDDVNSQNLAMLRVGDNLDEAIVRVEDRRL